MARQADIVVDLISSDRTLDFALNIFQSKPRDTGQASVAIATGRTVVGTLKTSVT